MRTYSLCLLVAAMSVCGCRPIGEAQVQSRCSTSGRSGTCTVVVTSISGAATQVEITNSDWWPGASGVSVAARITVGKGIVKVWWQEPDLEQTAVVVEAGQTGELKGKARHETIGGKRSIYINFEPLGEGEAKRAEEIKAEIRYSMP